MRFNICVFLIFAFLRVNVFANDKNAKNESVFVPTEEWQVVNKGKYNLVWFIYLLN